MSVATLQPPATVYREEQFFAWWVYALLAATASLGWYGVVTRPPAHAAAAPAMALLVAALAAVALPPVLALGALRMTTEVAPGRCRVWYGFLPTYRRAIALDLVAKVEVVTYRAVRDHVFWGVRTLNDGERVMTARGSRAVRLHLSDGSRVLIGSQRPEVLAEALERAMRPVL